MIEKMLKLLINKESRAKVLAKLESTTWTFKAFQEKVKESKKKTQFIQKRRQDYIYYLNDRYDSFFYSYIYFQLAFESFRKNYTSTEQCYKALEEFQVKIVE